MLVPKSKKRLLLEQWEELKSERSSWLSHWQDLNDHVKPRSTRIMRSKANDGGKRHSKIINDTATRAARTQSAGMQAGITSPARSWFRLTTPDPALDEVENVRQWLHDVEDVLRTIFAKSNFYESAHKTYRDIGTPGTSVMHMEDDDETVLRCYVYPIGTYCLTTDARGVVDSVWREHKMTVRQLVKRFGLSKCSNAVQVQFKNQNLNAWHDVLHVIQPNEDLVPNGFGVKGMAWASTWLEVNAEQDKLLREGGYLERPFAAPRWETDGEDVYGSSPGMEALGDIRALQHLEKQAAKAFDKVVDPPMRGPSSLQNLLASIVPGDITYVPDGGAGQKFEPAMEINPAALVAFENKIARHERRIERAYFSDLWQVITDHDEGKMTATEVLARQQEQMLLLGPTMSNISGEFLDPVVSRTFAIANRRGMIPQPPEELEGKDLRVEYLSVMHQAQKLMGTQAVERLTGFVATIANIGVTEALDKIDFDQTIDEVSTMYGVPPSMVRSDDQVAALRAKRAKEQAAAKAAEQAPQMASAVKDLGQANVGGDTALGQLVGATAGPIAQATLRR